MTTRQILYLFGFFGLALLAPVAYQIDRASASLPQLEGEIHLPGLIAPVEVDSDRHAIPTVAAANREDAYRALGWLHARDRLFQMDLMRRKSAGRLAEIFGAQAVALDQEQRIYDFERVAEETAKILPAPQQVVLRAYAEGVNVQMTQARERPIEFRILQYQPETWRPEDSLLVALGMFQTLNGDTDSERMLTVMEQTLPPELTAFLTPDTDEYATVLLGGQESHRPARPVPVQAITQALRENRSASLRVAIHSEEVNVGSNHWAVGGTKTADGRAILADDMHLPLGLPNTWYRARLRYAGADLNGVTLPGVPLLVAGSNGRIAFGFTNVEADLADLVLLKPVPGRDHAYRTPDGAKPYVKRVETILVRDASPVTLEIRDTLWGPVLPEALLGQRVALHWTALDPNAINLGLLELDSALTLEQAIAIFNRAGSPPQNVLLADDRGRIAWTFMGYFPRREGFDGGAARSWADGTIHWNGYIPPEQLPRLLDPPEGFLATANNRTLGKDYPFIIGQEFANAYRAHRIAAQLRAKPRWSEGDLLALQLDTVSEFYEFYRQQALSLLSGAALRDPLLAEARQAIELWDGKLDGGSLGIGLLARWRKELLGTTFAPMLRRCGELQPGFGYGWREAETPLRALLRERIPATLPDATKADWADFLLDRLRRTAAQLRSEFGDTPLDRLTWGRINSVQVRHPFSKAFAPAGWLLDLPELPAACNSLCIKVLHDNHGASERMAISPNHPEDGILHMPGGQSGHPFSPHYRDQHGAWVAGNPLPFLPGAAEFRLRIKPD